MLEVLHADCSSKVRFINTMLTTVLRFYLDTL